MCGLAGILVGGRTRLYQDMVEIGELFTRLLVLSEHRGPRATGAAWLDSAGKHRTHKAPLPASRFIASTEYSDWLSSIPLAATLLMGHTRWPTQGTHLDNRNNHPLVDRRVRCGTLLLTHNGNIPAVAQYFRHFGLPRRWGVDSEILVRLARRHALPAGIDVPALLAEMAQCEGHIAAVLAWAAHPATVILIRRDRPLWLAWQARRNLLAYASERNILNAALGRESGWHIENMDENTALVLNIKTLAKSATYDFE